MTRGKMVLAAAVLALVTISGGCCREGPLFAKYRARGQNADCPCPPYMNGHGMEGFGATTMPVSMPGGNGCPCTTMPGSVMPGAVMPGQMMPGGMDFTPQPPFPNGGFPTMPMPPAPGNGTQPGPATPRPADPSKDPTDPASARKTNGIATSKPGLLQ